MGSARAPFRWLLVATILVAFLSSEEDSALAPWHVPAGWVAAVLIALGLVWGLVGGEHARFANFLKPGQIAHHLRGLFAGKPERSIGHNALGGLAIVALLGTVGGIVSTASLIIGVAAAAAKPADILVAGVAGPVAGAMTMAAGEYVSVSSQSDTERTDLARERGELAGNA